MIIMDDINSKDLLKVLKYLKDWEKENCIKDEPKEELKEEQHKKLKPQYKKAVKSKVKRTTQPLGILLRKMWMNIIKNIIGKT